MRTCSSTPDADDLPIPCTISAHEKDRLVDGTIWAPYPHRCLVEKYHPLIAGVTVSPLCIYLRSRGFGSEWGS